MTLLSICWAYGRARIATLVGNERGASLVEYALLLALIAVICVGAITLIGSSVNKKLSSAGSTLD